MKRFKNILYIVDGPEIDQGVAEKVRQLALLNEARVTVTRAVEESYLEEMMHLLPENLQKFDDLVRDQYREELETIAADRRWQGISVSPVLPEAAGFIPLVRQVIRAGHDLVVKGGTLDQGLDQLSMRLIRKCPCPVWVIRNSHRGDFRCILGALDVSSSSSEAKGLNRKIAELTNSLAQRERGEAHYLHAWRLEFEMLMRGPRFNVRPEEIFELKKNLRLERRAALERILERSGIEPDQDRIHLREGDTASVIAELLEVLQVDVLVMGTVGRAGIPGLLIGNLAEKVLDTINCSVLTVKPDGFISPVRP